jgi:hypothetical protein
VLAAGKHAATVGGRMAVAATMPSSSRTWRGANGNVLRIPTVTGGRNTITDELYGRSPSLASIWEKSTVGNDEIRNNSVLAGCSSEIHRWIHACGQAWYSSVGPAFRRRGPTGRMGRYVIRGLL